MSAPPYTQPGLFDPIDPAGVDTPCPIPPSDGQRIQTQFDMTRRLMGNGMWWTLAELAHHTGASEAGQSARIRQLRNHPWHFRVERRRVKNSTVYEYRLLGPGLGADLPRLGAGVPSIMSPTNVNKGSANV